MKNTVTKKSELREPIALVGIGCRLPLGVSGPREFWRFLQNGEKAFAQFPENRQPKTCRSEKARRASSALPPAAYLDDVAHFDAGFFDISPREAAAMDPQQRILLEVAWETIEDAGWALDQIRETSTAVFAGAMGCDYLRIQQEFGTLTPFSALGLDTGLIANRVSCSLGLRGPSLTVNTASSSSLVAVHLAVQSLRAGEVERALVGGVNLILDLRTTEALRQMGVLSREGKAQAFTTEADGYVRGEGVVCVALKTLSRALLDNDRIYCLIVESAANNNGPNSNIAAPSRNAQIQLLAEAYSQREGMAGKIRYIEAHGSGTVAGDQAELAALKLFFETERTGQSPLLIGTVKNNLGHLEAAAGIAGLIKTALSIYHGQLPGSPVEASISALLSDRETPLKLLTGHEDWEVPAAARLAGVSSFGFGGTNCHVVLSASEFAGPRTGEPAAVGDEVAKMSSKPNAPQEKTERIYLIPVSARSPQALIELAEASALSLDRECSDYRLEDWAYTSATRRSHHFYRKAIVAESGAELSRKFFELAQYSPADLAGRRARPSRVILSLCKSNAGTEVFPDRYALENEVYRERFEECAAAVRQQFGWELENYLEPSESDRPDGVIEALLEWSGQISFLELIKALGFKYQAIVVDDFGSIVAEHFIEEISTSKAARKIARWCRSPREAFAAKAGRAMKKYRWSSGSGEIKNDHAERSLLVTVNLTESAAELKEWLNQECRPGETIEIALRRTDKFDISGVLKALGEIYENGADIDWNRQYAEGSGRLLPLPLYPWQRDYYWLTPADADFGTFEKDHSNGRKPELRREEEIDENNLMFALSADNVSVASRAKARPAAQRELRETEDIERCRAAVEQYLLKFLASALGRQPAEISDDVPLLYLGLESLTAMDLENAVAADFQVEVNLIQQLGEINRKQLGELITQQLIFLKRQSANGFENLKGEKTVNGWEIERI